MDTTRDLQVPSGYEVEGATLHPLEPASLGSNVGLPERSGFRGKLEGLKSKSVSKVHDVQCALQDRRDALRDGAKSQVTRMNDSMRTSPMKWAGIAAASGFGIGLIGRIARWRTRQRRITPDLVIIESRC